MSIFKYWGLHNEINKNTLLYLAENLGADDIYEVLKELDECHRKNIQMKNRIDILEKNLNQLKKENNNLKLKKELIEQNNTG